MSLTSAAQIAMRPPSAIAECLERHFVPRGRGDGRTAAHGFLDYGETVAAGCAGDDDDLIAEGFQGNGHADQRPSGEVA
jgi:hypothetical protein